MAFDSDLASARVCALSFCVEEGETHAARKGRLDKGKELRRCLFQSFTLKPIGGKDSGKRTKHDEVTSGVQSGRDAAVSAWKVSPVTLWRAVFLQSPLHLRS